MILIPCVEIHPVMTRIIKPARTCLNGGAPAGWAFPIGGHQPIRHMFLKTINYSIRLRSIQAVVSQHEIDMGIFLVTLTPKLTPLAHFIKGMLGSIETVGSRIVSRTQGIQKQVDTVIGRGLDHRVDGLDVRWI